jgi:hypothetical protein
MLRKSETSPCIMDNVAWLKARIICPAWRMVSHQPPYHTNNVKTSNTQWFLLFSQKWALSAMLQEMLSSGRKNIVV